jgi:predicted ABC-type exoprotein transport system permease subunit
MDSHMNIRSWPSLLIGLGIPIIGILVVMPLIADTSVHVFGIPLNFFWIFLMFPVTTLALWISWRIDGPHYRDEITRENSEVH